MHVGCLSVPVHPHDEISIYTPEYAVVESQKIKYQCLDILARLPCSNCSPQSASQDLCLPKGTLQSSSFSTHAFAGTAYYQFTVCNSQYTQMAAANRWQLQTDGDRWQIQIDGTVCMLTCFFRCAISAGVPRAGRLWDALRRASPRGMTALGTCSDKFTAL